MDKVKTILIEKIINNLAFDLKLQSEVKKWFNKINSCHLDLKRFFICLAIDLKNEHVKPDSIIKILKEIDFTNKYQSPLIQFDLIIKNQVDNFLAKSNCSDSSFKKGKYVSVITWSKLFKKISKYSSIPISFNQDKFFFDLVFTQKYIELDKIEEFAGWKDLTWVAPFNDLIDCKNIYTDKNLSINHVVDCLGLDPDTKKLLSGEPDKYIYIAFPYNFSKTCYQPTTLYGFWIETGGLYLSYIKKDGYGRTYPTSGKNLNMKERVFRSTNYSNKKFIPHILGEPDGKLKKSRKNIINEGLTRLSDEK